VLAADGSPATIIRTTEPGTISVDWEIYGAAVPALEGNWIVTAYFEAIGPGVDQEISQKSVAVKSGIYSAIPYPHFSYKLDLPIPIGISSSSIYKPVGTVTFQLPDGTTGPIAGYDEGPLVQLYNPG
jgi:hypothetical protein